MGNLGSRSSSCHLVTEESCSSILSKIKSPPERDVVVNYKLALTKSIANCWTAKAFAICLYWDSWWTSLVAQMVKHLPTMWETRVRSLGQEDPLEKEMATTGTLAWRTPWTEQTVGYSPWGCKESDTTELSFSHPFLYRDSAPCCSSC